MGNNYTLTIQVIDIIRDVNKASRDICHANYYSAGENLKVARDQIIELIEELEELNYDD